MIARGVPAHESVYTGRVRRLGLLARVSAAAVLPVACFRGEFLDNTCEQIAGCGEVTSGTSTGAASTTTTLPTTSTSSTGSSSTGDASSGTTGAPRVELNAVAFRLNSLGIVDPDIFAPLLAGQICTNVRNDLSSVLNSEVAAGDTNILLLTQAYDPDVDQINYLLYQKPTCDVALGECTLDATESPLMFPVFNVDAGNCATYDTSVMKPANVTALNIPDSPCFRTPEGSLPLKISDSLGYINLIRGQMSSSYDPDDQDPSVGLGDSVIVGFIRKEEAEKITYMYNNLEINLWSVIAGSDHPDECATEKGEPPDVDMLDLGGGPMGEPDGIPETVGVWMFFNFTAERVRVFAYV